MTQESQPDFSDEDLLLRLANAEDGFVERKTHFVPKILRKKWKGVFWLSRLKRLEEYMNTVKKIALFAVITFLLAVAAFPQPRVLRDAKSVEILPTEILNPEKVKVDSASATAEELLRQSLRRADVEIKPSPLKAVIAIEEWTPGNLATRMMVGFGAGRSTVTAHLVVRDGKGKELANIRIHVRGDTTWSSYQGSEKQKKQAQSKFEQKLYEAIRQLM